MNCGLRLSAVGPTLLICAVLFVACDEGALPTVPTAGTPEQQLAGARARWSALRVANYEFTGQLSCFCPPDVRTPSTFRVSQGVGVIVTPLPDAARTTLERFRTIEHLFGEIQSALERQPYALAVDYDPAFGYPRSVQVDQRRELVDEEWAFTVTDFRRSGS
jgi:hypothetical protein